MVLKIAHRGGLEYAPENTLEAFRKAVELGVDAVEFDVHCTKDNRIIVMHDENVKRTTDGAGLIRSLSFKEIRKFHKPNGEPVPTLQEALDILKNRCICKIDIKGTSMEEKIIDIIKKNHIEDSVIITSEIFSVLKKIKHLFPRIRIEAGGFGFRKRISIGEMIKKAKNVKADIVSPYYSMTTRKLVEEAHRNGLEVHVWIVNDRKTIEKMKSIGVDGITTDYPDRI